MASLFISRFASLKRMVERLRIPSIVPDTPSANISALDTSKTVFDFSVQPISAVPMLKLTGFRKPGRCLPSQLGRVGIGIVNSHVVDFIVTA